MSQSNVSQPSCLIEQYRTEWEQYYPLARWLVRRKLIRLDGTVPSDIDDRISEAIAHAWQGYPRLRQSWYCLGGVIVRVLFTPSVLRGRGDAGIVRSAEGSRGTIELRALRALLLKRLGCETAAMLRAMHRGSIPIR